MKGKPCCSHYYLLVPITHTVLLESICPLPDIVTEITEMIHKDDLK